MTSRTLSSSKLDPARTHVRPAYGYAARPRCSPDQRLTLTGARLPPHALWTLRLYPISITHQVCLSEVSSYLSPPLCTQHLWPGLSQHQSNTHGLPDASGRQQAANSMADIDLLEHVHGRGMLRVAANAARERTRQG